VAKHIWAHGTHEDLIISVFFGVSNVNEMLFTSLIISDMDSLKGIICCPDI
jgi:hypothetical protein